MQYPDTALRQVLDGVNEVLIGSPSIQPSSVFEQFEDTVLYPSERVVFVLVFPFEDVTLREIFDRPDEQTLFDEEVAGVPLGDAHDVRDEIGDETGFLNAVVPLTADIDHSERIGIFSAVQVNNILQHPEQLPSMYELEQMNPSVSDATVYKHIQRLIDAGIVREVALPDDERRQGYPWKFYGLTDEGRTFLEDHNLLGTEETLQRIYETISDKPEKMVKYENAPRPAE